MYENVEVRPTNMVIIAPSRFIRFQKIPKNITGNKEAEAWIYRDDIGSPHGIKGYEEQVNSVGMHHGHSHWPSEGAW